MWSQVCTRCNQFGNFDLHVCLQFCSQQLKLLVHSLNFEKQLLVLLRLFLLLLWKPNSTGLKIALDFTWLRGIDHPTQSTARPKGVMARLDLPKQLQMFCLSSLMHPANLTPSQNAAKKRLQCRQADLRMMLELGCLFTHLRIANNALYLIQSLFLLACQILISQVQTLLRFYDYKSSCQSWKQINHTLYISSTLLDTVIPVITPEAPIFSGTSRRREKPSWTL